jgi:hypothetical protein
LNEHQDNSTNYENPNRVANINVKIDWIAKFVLKSVIEGNIAISFQDKHAISFHQTMLSHNAISHKVNATIYKRMLNKELQ